MSPGNEQRPGGGTEALKSFGGDTHSLPAFPEEVVSELTRFGVRFIQDAIATARPASWLRRAQTFEDARPKPGDFNGQATPQEVEERDRRLAGTAERCRVHAAFLTENPAPLAAYERSLVAGLLSGGGPVEHRTNAA